MKAKIIPNSRRFEIAGFDSSKELKIKVKSPAEKNRANLEVIKELEKKLKTNARIIQGFKSPRKKILINLPEQEALEKILH